MKTAERKEVQMRLGRLEMQLAIVVNSAVCNAPAEPKHINSATQIHFLGQGRGHLDSRA